MTDAEFKTERIGFLKGAIEGIRLYAIWKDGEQKVGCMEKPLKDVLQPYVEELARLTYNKPNNSVTGAGGVP